MLEVIVVRPALAGARDITWTIWNCWRLMSIRYQSCKRNQMNVFVFWFDFIKYICLLSFISFQTKLKFTKKFHAENSKPSSFGRAADRRFWLHQLENILYSVSMRKNHVWLHAWNYRIFLFCIFNWIQSHANWEKKISICLRCFSPKFVVLKMSLFYR